MYGSKLIGTTLGREIGKLFDSPLTTAEVADICAFNLLDDIELKQALLEEPDVARRVRRIVESVRRAHPAARAYQAVPSSVDMN